MAIQNNPQSNDDTRFQYAQTIRGIVERIEFQLGEDTCYPKERDSGTFERAWILARVTDTLKWLQGRRPSLFAESTEFTLEAGTRHTLPDECEEPFEITEVLSSKGDVPVCKADYKDLVSATRLSQHQSSCGGGFGIHHYAINPANPREFLFSPVPTSDIKVRANCNALNSFLGDQDKPITCEGAKYINAVVEWVLFQAQSSDGENATLAGIADQHRITFFDLAPASKATQQESRT